jgi:uncharacterized membrane protein YphA (DoxX/SURF4 family)
MELLRNKSYLILRISLGIFFLWVGVLKLFAVGPSIELIQSSLPANIGQSPYFTFIIALVEMLIGASFLSNRLTKFASIIMVVSVFLISIPIFIIHGFDPRFPVLSLAGELVLKNMILIGAGLVLLTENTKPDTTIKPAKTDSIK